MDPQTAATIQAALEFLKAGKRQEAQAILIPIVRADPENAEAWYLLGFAVGDPEKRRYSFEQVLRIDPSNQAAQKQIARLVKASPGVTSIAQPAVSDQPAPKKKPGSTLLAGIAGVALLLVCVIAVGGWWMWQNGLPALSVSLPITPSPAFDRSTPRPTVTPYARSSLTPTSALTSTPSSTPPPTATRIVRTYPTTNATPNMAAFAIVLTPGTGVTLDLSKLTRSEDQVFISWADSGQVPGTDLKNPGLVLHAASDKFGYLAGDTATFVAQLKNKNAGLAGATVTIAVGLPDGTTQTISMKDYGGGVYAATYTIPDQNGFAWGTVKAQGNNNGTSFTRQALFQMTLAPNDIQLTDEFSDKIGPPGQDGNKTLDVQVGINSSQTGEFGVSAELISGDQTISTITTVVTLVPGHNAVTLHFWGKDIRFYRLDGPYKVSVLAIEDNHTGSYIDVENKGWQTSAYHWRDFGDELCFSLVAQIEPVSGGTFSISPTPNCPNGQYLSGTLVTLTAKANPGFKFKNWFVDVGGVDTSQATITFGLHMDGMRAIVFFDPKP